MWKRISKHLEESRIFQLPTKPYLEFKFQNEHYYLSSRLFYPFSIDFSGDYSPRHLKNIRRNSRLSPQTPFHIELSSDKYFCSCFRYKFPSSFKYLPSFFHDTYLSSTFVIESGSISSIFKIESNKKFISSLSFNPLSASLSIYFEHFGLEYLHDFDEEQMSISFLYQRYFKRTSITILSSIYGNFSTLITTELKRIRVTSFLEMNLYTLGSSSTIGFSIPFGTHFVNISFCQPKFSLTIEMSINNINEIKENIPNIHEATKGNKINKEHKVTKRGISIYLPLNFHWKQNKT